jgi:hypothetical protein
VSLLHEHSDHPGDDDQECDHHEMVALFAVWQNVAGKTQSGRVNGLNAASGALSELFGKLARALRRSTVRDGPLLSKEQTTH